MVNSADLLSDVIADIEFPIPADNFTVYELARLTADYERPLFKDKEFRLLLEQGIRLHVDSSVDVRARLVERLRHQAPKMDAAARKITPDVISGLEDIECPLYRIGAVVSSYTNHLFQKLESMPDSSEAEDEARRLLEEWRDGKLERQTLMEELREIGPEAVAPAADMLFESPDDRAAAETALGLLSTLESNVSARILAYVVSEPILEEEQEERAQQMLGEIWPTPLPYIRCNLKKHSHENLPYRWFELLVATGYTRAVDRILENWLTRPRDGVIPLVAIYLERPRDNPWMEEIDWCQINGWYANAAQFFDQGIRSKAHQYLDIILQIEPEYPFARALARALGD